MDETRPAQDQLQLGRLLTLDEQELLTELGRQVSPQMHGLDPALLVAIAQAWLQDRWVALREATCSSDAVRSARSALASDEAVVVSAVADAVSSLASGPAAAVAAVLIVRYGLDRLCNDC